MQETETPSFKRVFNKLLAPWHATRLSRKSHKLGQIIFRNELDGHITYEFAQQLLKRTTIRGADSQKAIAGYNKAWERLSRTAEKAIRNKTQGFPVDNRDPF